MLRFLIAATVLLLMPVSAECAGIRQKNINKQNYSSLKDLLVNNGFRTSSTSSSATGSKKGVYCFFQKNQRSISCSNTKIELLMPTVFESNHPWILTMDWFKTLRPILYPATVPRSKVSSITIDMGHGGSDPGALGAFSKEKMITLAIGRKTAEILRAYGFKVHFTRNSDVQVPLSSIAQIQKRHKSDLFISIHVNSTKSKTISGLETFCLTPAGAASSNGGKVSQTVHTGNKHDAANMLLAWNIHRTILARTGAVDRGVKRARFAVLRDINVPGVLIETGFISNRAEERKLNDPKYVEKIARGIAEGIVAFTRSTKGR